jgi:hypothetical protein
LEAQNDQLQTAVHFAAAGGYGLVVEFLVQSHGLDINARDKDLQSPLHLAVRHAALDAVRVMVKLGANPLQQDVYRKRPVEYAAWTTVNGAAIEAVLLVGA